MTGEGWRTLDSLKDVARKHLQWDDLYGVGGRRRQGLITSNFTDC
jgi:hypothetical protein